LSTELAAIRRRLSGGDVVLKANQRLCVWCGPVGVLFWLIGFAAFAHFVPPPAPTHPPAEVVALYEANRTGIRIGMLLSTFGAALFMPYFSVFSVQMCRIEGRYAPLAWAQLGLASATVLGFILPMIFIQVAAFRPDRAPSEIQLFNDMGWVWFIGYVSVGVLQWLVIGVAILRDPRVDRGAEPILPRWSGYLCMWTALLFAPGCMCVFFKSGPLAWDGLFTWWIPASVFSLWMGAMTPVLLRAIAQQPDDESPDGPSAGLEEVRAETAAIRAELAALRDQIAVGTNPTR
jgi:hypothetical protein